MYSIADLAEKSGGELRALKFFAESGALVPLPGTDSAGRGVHRKFSRDELIVCCFLAAAYAAGAQIGKIKEIAKIVRSGIESEKGKAEIELALKGKQVPILNIAHDSISYYFVNVGEAAHNVVSVVKTREGSWMTSINVLPWLDKVPV